MKVIAKREFQRETNTIDNEIYGIVNQTNKEAMEENSNKDATVLATQRDLIAGEFSKDYCRRLLLPQKSYKLMMMESFIFMIWIITFKNA